MSPIFQGTRGLVLRLLSWAYWTTWSSRSAAATDLMSGNSPYFIPRIIWRLISPLNLVVSHWKLAALDDDAVRRYAVVVEILRKLKDENKLSDEQAGWLTLAEKHLTSSLGAPTVQ